MGQQKRDKLTDDFIGLLGAEEDAAADLKVFEQSPEMEISEEADRAIQNKIVLNLMGRKSRKFSTRLVVAILCALLLLGLLGMVGIHTWDYILRDHSTFSNVQRAYTDKDCRQAGFHFIPVELPRAYDMEQLVPSDNVRVIIYSDGNGHNILFTESTVELLSSVDTENAEIEKVVIASGYEGMLIQKNGSVLLWEQDGYFYQLFGTDPEVDLLQIAATLKKL